MNEQERAAWLAERRTGVGSSDAAAVCGFGRWGTPFSVWLDKMGELPDKDTNPKRWGRKLEETIAEAYAEETGAVVGRPAYTIMRHPEHAWMLASLDRLATRPDGKEVVVELKTSGFDDGWGEPWTDQIPDDYHLQVQHQLAVVGLDEADVAVLIAGSDFRVYTVRRKDTLIEKLVRIESEFWAHVENRIPPKPDWEHPETPELLRNLYGVTGGLHISLSNDALGLVNLWQQWKGRRQAADEEVARSRAQLDFLLGEAECASLPDGRKLLRRKRERGGYTVGPSSYVELRLKEGR